MNKSLETVFENLKEYKDNFKIEQYKDDDLKIKDFLEKIMKKKLYTQDKLFKFINDKAGDQAEDIKVLYDMKGGAAVYNSKLNELKSEIIKEKEKEGVNCSDQNYIKDNNTTMFIHLGTLLKNKTKDIEQLGIIGFENCVPAKRECGFYRNALETNEGTVLESGTSQTYISDSNEEYLKKNFLIVVFI